MDCHIAVVLAHLTCLVMPGYTSTWGACDEMANLQCSLPEKWPLLMVWLIADEAEMVLWFVALHHDSFCVHSAVCGGCRVAIQNRLNRQFRGSFEAQMHHAQLRVLPTSSCIALAHCMCHSSHTRVNLSIYVDYGGLWQLLGGVCLCAFIIVAP